MAGDDPALKGALAALLAAHEAVCREFELLELLLRRAARTHELIGRTMTVPGIGPITAAAFVVIDTRIASERGQRCRLHRPDPTSLQSGKVDYSGRISKCGTRCCAPISTRRRTSFWRE
jgi:transposase